MVTKFDPEHGGDYNAQYKIKLVDDRELGPYHLQRSRNQKLYICQKLSTPNMIRNAETPDALNAPELSALFVIFFLYRDCFV